MTRFLTVLIVFFVSMSIAGCSSDKSAHNPADTSGVSQEITNKEEEQAMKCKLTAGQNQATAVIYDSETARDFRSLLPLTLSLSDFNQTEKIADLPRKLNLDGAPAGFDPDVGDICLYAPWGNIAIFYKDFGYSDGLVPLGRIESGLGYFTEQPGRFDFTIDLVDEEDD